MINNRTLLILGAGASCDYGFPTGQQLLEDIINFLQGKLLHGSSEAKKILLAWCLLKKFP